MSWLKGKIHDQAKLSDLHIKRNENRRRKFCIFTHINWDISLGFGEGTFQSFTEWIDFTIETISSICSVDWIIKIHPAEFFSESERNDESGVYMHILRRFPQLPPHIVVIPPSQQINPINLIQDIDGAVCCCGTSGLEAAALGKIVINAIVGYYSCNGFTIDPMAIKGQKKDRIAAYKDILQNAAILPFPTEHQVRLAQIFLYSYFKMRNSKDISYDNNWGLQINRPWQWLQFLPRKNNEIDAVCDGFLSQKDIFFREIM